MRKQTAIEIATKTINEVFAIMSAHDLDSDLIHCVGLLDDCRIKLDRLAISKAERKEMDMKQREDEKTRKQRELLSGLEKQYVHLARVNPQSINDTQAHLANIDKVVRDMKRIRGRLGLYARTDGFLKELLYPQTDTAK